MTRPTHEGKLDVPGATLHYDVTGTGPVVLLVAGAPADATTFAGLVPLLADDHTVVTYDPRGYSRSSLSDGPVDQTVEEHADDLHRLLAEVTDEPALVLGISGGAVVALELATTHPGQVRALVAHEPAATEVLPDREHWRGVHEEIVETFRTQGPFAAAGRFMEAVTGGQAPPPPPEMTPEVAAMMERFARNFALFFPHQLIPFTSRVPDVDALRATGVPVVWGSGADSQGQPCHRAGTALAELHGGRHVELPGDHQGAMTHPVEFAAALRAAFAGAAGS